MAKPKKPKSLVQAKIEGYEPFLQKLKDRVLSAAKGASRTLRHRFILD